MIKQKFKAFLFHFCLSLVIFSLFIILLRYYWYPEPFFTASGGWQGLKIVAFIDLILGPLLTFIVFNKTKPKKELKIDLSIILIIQLSALLWGIYTVYDQRPIAITFWGNKFYTVPYNSVSNQYSNSSQLKSLIETPRQLYVVPKPNKIVGIQKLNEDVKNKQLPPFELIDRFEPINAHFKIIQRHSIDINEVITQNETMKSQLNILLKESSNIDKNYYIPLVSRYRNIIFIFNSDGSLLGSLKAPFKDQN